MFKTFKQRLLLGIFIFIILSIPIGAYIISEQKSKPPKPSPTPLGDRTITTLKTSPTPNPSPTPKKLDLSSLLDEDKEEATSAPLTTATTFGPTLEFKITIDGRPLSNQATKLFVGITDSKSVTSPQYLLSFNIDVPSSGAFSGLSLAGLTVGGKYSAYLKGPAQIATSSAFTMDANISYLNGNQAITLITGDLNEDNTINSADYAIAKALYNTNQNSANWNGNVDLNKDGVINAADIAIILKNFGKTGSSGVWQSTPSGAATSSASLSPATGSANPNGLPNDRQGFWIWVPF